MKILIPAYVYPGAPPRRTWDQWIAPGGRSVSWIIANPGSPGGPGTFTDTNYAAVIAQAQAQGIRVFGYVDTSYTAIAISTVTQQIDLWKTLYGINDIFFDQVSSGAGDIAYYTTITNYVRGSYRATVLASLPDAYWRLDETGSGPFVDIANGHNLTPNGTIVSDASLLVTDPDASAKFDYNTTFDKAISSYTVSQQPLTIEFWIKPASLTGSNAAGYSIACSCGVTGGWVAHYMNTGIWALTYQGRATYQFTTSATAAIGTKQHVVFVLQSANTIDLYIDGAFQQTVSTAAIIATSNVFAIAGYGTALTSGRAQATIDDVSIYKRAMPASEILSHYNAGITAPPGSAVVMLNHGTDADISYVGISDIQCTFEGPKTTYDAYVPAQAWEVGVDASRICHLVYNCASDADVIAAIAQARSQNAGHVHMVDTAVWFDQSAFWPTELQQVDQLNAPRRVASWSMVSDGVR